MKCKDCEFCKLHSSGTVGEYHCKHPELDKYLKKYEARTKKKIKKAAWFIGYNMIKTNLRYCPLKEKI